jgi:ATP/maltotriose-dependent transcriptional regulator MalT
MGEVEPHIGPEYAKRPSAREVEILVLLARGMTNAEVAEALGVSGTPIKRHLANVYEKLGVRSGAVALRSGLLSPEEA